MSQSRKLYVVNGSSLVTNSDVKKMAGACNTQIRDHVVPAWGMNRVIVEYVAGTLQDVQAKAPKGSWVISILDKPDDPGALGWHSEDDKDHVYGEIFAEPCLTDGKSTALTGPYSVSSVLSHEVIETFGDQFCNSWTDTGRGYLVATELCDPVEADGYLINFQGTQVQVSNFVLPEWFDAIVSAGEKFDYMGRCSAPFSMTAGGYWVQMPAGRESQQFKRTRSWLKDSGFDVRDSGATEVVFSPEMPEWKRDLKMKRGRNAIKRGLVAA